MEKAFCRSEYDNGRLTIRVTGEIDHHTAKPLREEMDTAIYLYRAASVTIDLRGVGFMDSAGLGLILGRYAKIKELGGRLTVADPEPSVEKILRLAGCEKLMSINKSEVKK